MALDRIRISSSWGELTARLASNDTARAFSDLLPLTLELEDHLRQEKTGRLPETLTGGTRQKAFSAGTLGLWSSSSFVIYYRDGSVPSPGIAILGQVDGDASVFDRPGPVTVTIRHGD